MCFVDWLPEPEIGSGIRPNLTIADEIDTH